MSTPRRPSILNRALSTPPTTPNSTNPTTPAMKTAGPGQKGLHPGASVLTPPTSPRQSQSSSNISDLATLPVSTSRPLQSHYVPDIKHRHGGLEPIQTDVTDDHTTRPESHQPPTVLECPFDFEILKDDHGRDIFFGTGAWSTVYKATTHARPQPKHHQATTHSNISATSIITPPASPTTTPLPILVAVKKPSRRDANPILQSEAKTLGHLHIMPDSERYVVPFYGVTINEPSTLVLGAIPYSLEDHIRKCIVAAQSSANSTWSKDPIVGSTAIWLNLAGKLITALAWLHTQAGVVHGDVKPGNVLLSPTRSPPHSSGPTEFVDPFPYTPLFADFSSSQLLPTSSTTSLNSANTTAITPNTLSAVTPSYTAPELLSSSVLRNPLSTATPASDVFSLAVTLLVAATGQLQVYPGASVFQRQAMATQGWNVLQFIRGGDGGMRVGKGGPLEKVLEPAVRKDGMGRVSAKEWVEIVQAVNVQDGVGIGNGKGGGNVSGGGRL